MEAFLLLQKIGKEFFGPTSPELIGKKLYLSPTPACVTAICVKSRKTLSLVKKLFLKTVFYGVIFYHKMGHFWKFYNWSNFKVM